MAGLIRREIGKQTVWFSPQSDDVLHVSCRLCSKPFSADQLTDKARAALGRRTWTGRQDADQVGAQSFCCPQCRKSGEGGEVGWINTYAQGHMCSLEFTVGISITTKKGVEQKGTGVGRTLKEAKDRAARKLKDKLEEKGEVDMESLEASDDADDEMPEA